MATFNDFINKKPYTRSLAEVKNVVRRTFTLSSVDGTPAASDVIELFKIAPYCAITKLVVEIKTAAGAVLTGNFGITGADITDDPNGLDDSVDLNAVAGTKTYSAEGTDAGLYVNFGASGGSVNVTVDGAVGNAEIIVTLELAQFNKVND